MEGIRTNGETAARPRVPNREFRSSIGIGACLRDTTINNRVILKDNGFFFAV